jgi:hypothetical protein
LAGSFRKDARKIETVRKTSHFSDFLNAVWRKEQPLHGDGHSAIDHVLSRRGANMLAKDADEMVAAQVT